MKNKKGFTLVELLAVIVILAIILVIAVPTIMETINNARKGTLESTAKLIAGTAEKRLLENKVLGIEDEVKCEDIAEYNDEDYASCDIRFDENGKAYVTIVGSGKFEGMQVIDATASSATVIDAVPLKFGRAYNYRLESGELAVSYILYEDGSIKMYEAGETSTLPRNTATYTKEGIEVAVGEFTTNATISEDGKTVKLNMNGTEIVLELDENNIYYGKPYNGVANEDGRISNVSFVFLPDGTAYIMSGEAGDMFTVTYEDNKIIFPDNSYMLVSDDGTSIESYTNDEISINKLLIDKNPVYFGTKYIGYIEGSEVYIMFSESGTMELYADDQLAQIGDAIYLKNSVYVQGTIFNLSDDKNYIYSGETLFTAEDAPPAPIGIIPEGGVYKTGLVYNEETKIWDDSNAITYNAGDYLDFAPKTGDIYTYGDYEYRYNLYSIFGNEWVEKGDPFTDYSGWAVIVRDNTKTEYEDMPSLVLNHPVLFASSTYAGCKSLINAPKLSSKLVSMSAAFIGCTSLKTAPSIPETIEYMDYSFDGCTSLETPPELTQARRLKSLSYAFNVCYSLKTAPRIPESVTTLTRAFADCTSLSGTIEINTSTQYFTEALLNTQITAVIGSTPYRNEILATKTAPNIQ